MPPAGCARETKEGVRRWATPLACLVCHLAVQQQTASKQPQHSVTATHGMRSMLGALPASKAATDMHPVIAPVQQAAPHRTSLLRPCTSFSSAFRFSSATTASSAWQACAKEVPIRARVTHVLRHAVEHTGCTRRRQHGGRAGGWWWPQGGLANAAGMRSTMKH